MFFIKFVSAGNLLWGKVFTDSTSRFPPWEYEIQGYTMDGLGNTYCCYSKYPSDTTISFITKINANGELLWQKNILPISFNKNYESRFERKAKLFIDKDQNIVLIIGAYIKDTTNSNGEYKRVLILNKFNSLGEEINSKHIPLKYYSSTSFSAIINDIKVSSSGDIFISHYYSLFALPKSEYYCNMMGFNKNFKTIFEKEIDLAEPGNEEPCVPPFIAINDTSLTLCYSSTVDGNNFLVKNYLMQFSLSTGELNWRSIQNEPSGGYTRDHIEIIENSIYTSGLYGEINKYGLDGTLKKYKRIIHVNDFIYDNSTKQIYTIAGNSKYGRVVRVFNLDLEEVCIINPDVIGINNLGYKFTQHDSILYTCIRKIDTFIITRMSTNCSFIDQTKHIFPKPIIERYLLEEPLVDKKGNAVVLSDFYIKNFDDSINYQFSAGALYAFKINFEKFEDTQELQDQTYLKVYPIPWTSGVLNIKLFLSEPENVDLSLFDISGRKIVSLFKGYLTNGIQYFYLDQYLLANKGLYFLNLNTIHNSITRKILIQKE
ncbi:MAG TPA: T9SS type A sorting domain-containing protein [Chitinophagaceae bacterium]|nr:T9SS type A sorting domain-containing protein [Chitinophagaceae bacterium]